MSWPLGSLPDCIGYREEPEERDDPTECGYCGTECDGVTDCRERLSEKVDILEAELGIARAAAIYWEQERDKLLDSVGKAWATK